MASEVRERGRAKERDAARREVGVDPHGVVSEDRRTWRLHGPHGLVGISELIEIAF